MITVLFVLMALVTWLVVSAITAFFIGKVVQLRERRSPMRQWVTTDDKVVQHG